MYFRTYFFIILKERTCINEERLKIYIAYENILNMDKSGLMQCVKILNFPD